MHFNKFQFPKTSKTFNFESKFNNICLKYSHPPKSEQKFIVMDFLAKKFIKFYSAENLFKILLLILLENSFIFVSDEIEILTSSV